tara:strand:+ start:4974 stop:6245 length:1272 start_codon:yes stop_codon:yes gene_type:complete
MKIDNKRLFVFIISISLFIIGFIFNEDSSGGGKLDFELHEWGNFLKFKSGIIDSLTSIEYESSRMPLFLIINAFNPFDYNQYFYRLSNFIFNFLILIAFYISIRSFKQFSNNDAIILTSIFMFSPYFRTSSYWAHQENLPFLFLFLSIFFFNYFKLNTFEKQNYFYKVLTLAILSSLSFYSDQKFIFLSFSFFLVLVISLNSISHQIKVFLIFFITSIPALYLFYIWKGILPIESQFRLGIYFENLSYAISIIIFYFLPILIHTIKKKILKDIIFDKKSYFFFIVILTINILFIPNFDETWGNGVISKVFYFLKNTLGINLLLLKIIYFFYIQFGSLLIFFILKKNIKNLLPFLTLILVSLIVEKTYNEYFDPLMFVLIFFYFNFEKYIIINKRKYINTYFLFYFILLSGANIYYKFYNLNLP